MPQLLRSLLVMCLVLTRTPGFAQTAGLVALADSSTTVAQPSERASSAGSTEVPATIYHVAEQMPAFPGGPVAFQKFLRSELHYPEEALRNGVSGKVYVRFIVTEEGRIRDAEIVKGLSNGLNEEALRIIRIMPWWTPGKNGSKPVWVQCTMPIEFRVME